MSRGIFISGYRIPVCSHDARISIGFPSRCSLFTVVPSGFSLLLTAFRFPLSIFHFPSLVLRSSASCLRLVACAFFHRLSSLVCLSLTSDLPGRNGRLPSRSPHRTVRARLMHTVPRCHGFATSIGAQSVALASRLIGLPQPRQINGVGNRGKAGVRHLLRKLRYPPLYRVHVPEFQRILRVSQRQPHDPTRPFPFLRLSSGQELIHTALALALYASSFGFPYTGKTRFRWVASP